MPVRGPIAVIVNPRSQHGFTGRRWPRLERAMRAHLPEFDTFFTEAPGHATELTRKALRSGYRRIVSVGGDGTHSEVTNGFFDGTEIVNPEAVLAILPSGTGSDLARTLGIPRRRRSLPHLASDHIVHADVGRVTFHTEPEGEATAYFLNTLHIGIGGAVGEWVNANSKAYGGFFSFFIGTMVALATFRPPMMRFTVDGELIEQENYDLIVAKGQYDGGGMHVAPNARLDSGTFEVYLIGKFGLLDGLINLPKIYRGQLTDRPDVIQYYQARRLTVETGARVVCALDGETPGICPATIDIVPNALRVVTGEGT